MLRLSDIKEWFWEPGKPNAIDCVHPVTGKGVYSGETLDEVRQRYPNAQIATWEEIEAAEEALFVTEPVEVTRERWDEMLNVLPPVQWTRESGAETFKISEMTSGNITAVFCRIGERYFEMSDRVTRSHRDIADKCAALL